MTMKEALMMMGGGVMTDDLTAQAAHVRAGDTFYGAGSDDEQVGTLVDRSIPVGIIIPDAGDAALHMADAVRAEEASDGVVRVMLAPPVGDYPGGESGAYVGALPSALGVTADKIASGQMAAGIEGAYDADGTASASDMKAGIVAYSKGVKVTGKQTDYGNVAKTLNAGESYNINEGFYGSGKISAASLASQQNAVASAFGITAAKVANGQTIAGVAGAYKGTAHSFGNYACYSARSSNHDYEDQHYDESFTMPRAGIVYYSGFSSLLHHTESSSNTPIYCRIYKNGTIVDSRDIVKTDTWIWRGTMVNKSFTANKGDVIRIQLQATGCDALAIMFAVCMY
jgi:hypothetical protein